MILAAKAPSLQAREIPDTFKPAWWCRGSHCQTIVGNVLRRYPKVKLRRERLEIPDGDFLDLDWMDGPEGAPIVMILHGLASSPQSAYVQTFLDEIRKNGWRAAVVNPRGQSGEANRLRETNHGGKTEDLEWVLDHVVRDKNSKQIYLVGFSLGGNVVLKWLEEKGGAVPPQVRKAAAISVPYDLARTTLLLDRGFNQKVYTYCLLKKLKAYALEKEKRYPGTLDPEKIKPINTFKIYDREVTARLNGFKDENEYWARSSSGPGLGQIRLPTLLIHAANDPFLPGAYLPVDPIRESPYLTLLLTRDGGHLGFLAGPTPWQQEHWLEISILDYFRK